MKRIIVFILILSLSVLFLAVNDKSLLDVVDNLNIDVCDVKSKNLLTVNSGLDSILSSMNIEVKSQREIAGRLIIEGYTNIISNYVVIDNSKINIQLSVCDNEILMGSPLITSSF